MDIRQSVPAAGYAIVWMKDRASFKTATCDDMRIFGVSVRVGGPDGQTQHRFACCPVQLMEDGARKLYLECRQKPHVRPPTTRQVTTLLR